MIAEGDECVNVLGDHALLITVRKDSAYHFSLGIAVVRAISSEPLRV